MLPAGSTVYTKVLEHLELADRNLNSFGAEKVLQFVKTLETEKEQLETERRVVERREMELRSIEEQLRRTERQLHRTEEQLIKTKKLRYKTAGHHHGTAEQHHGTAGQQHGTAAQHPGTDGQMKGTEEQLVLAELKLLRTQEQLQSTEEKLRPTLLGRMVAKFGEVRGSCSVREGVRNLLFADISAKFGLPDIYAYYLYRDIFIACFWRFSGFMALLRLPKVDVLNALLIYIYSFLITLPITTVFIF